MQRFWNLLTPLPPVEMSEDPDAFRLRAELPGYHRDDLHIAIADHELILADEHNRFRRIVQMPAFIDRDAIRADLDDGRLTVTLPKLDVPPANYYPAWCC